jgi:plastocyanin
MLPSESSSTGQPADSGAASADEIVAIGLRFMPADLTVPVGTTVRWVNGEAITHTVTSGSWGEVNKSTGLRGTQSADGMYDHSLSPKGEDGDTFEFTFTEPGTYTYFCKPHLTMFGTITVQ